MKPRNDQSLSHRKLLDLVSYDAETGVFRTKVKTRTHLPGDTIGRIQGGYHRIYINGLVHQAHRLAWFYVYGEWPVRNIDHINQDAKDNRIANLRLCSMTQNEANKGLQKNNSSGYKGVSFSKKQDKFIAQIKFNKTYQKLGSFADPQHAAHAYNKAAIQLFGEFACLNPIGVDYE